MDGRTDGWTGGQTDEADSNIPTWWSGPGWDNYRPHQALGKPEDPWQPPNLAAW